MLLFFSANADEKHGKWTNSIVSYEISDEFTEEYKLKILEAMKMIEEISCIRFQPRNQNLPGETFVTIKHGKGCSSTIGTYSVGQNLEINLNETRCTEGTIIHELMHTLGFHHENQRRDRDDFIEVHFENILEDRKKEYNITSHTLLQTPYDYGSIMHFRDIAFTKNGNKTFTPIKDLRGNEVGQRDDLSDYDKVKINRYYKCYEDNPKCKDKLLNCDELNMKEWYCEEKEEDVVLENCAKTCGMCRYFEKPSQKM